MAIGDNIFDVEINDSEFEREGWKNSRYNGSKLTGQAVNFFLKGDVSYGINPVIENKTSCIFLGKDIDRTCLLIELPYQ